jgi:hypothetical protein
MMLYTIMSEEDIFEEEQPTRQFLTIAGMKLEVEQTSPGWGQITRLISTDPAAFLDPRWQPGVWVRL